MDEWTVTLPMKDLKNYLGHRAELPVMSDSSHCYIYFTGKIACDNGYFYVNTGRKKDRPYTFLWPGDIISLWPGSGRGRQYAIRE